MYTAAVIGLGGISWLYDREMPENCITHCSAYQADQRVKLVAGFDPDPEKSAEFSMHTGVTTVDSVEALLALKPDVVSIASPSEHHTAHLERCLGEKVPMIWLEKPVCVSKNDSVSIQGLLSRELTSKVLVGFQRRYLPAYKRLKDVVSDQTLGECTALSIVYSRGLLINAIHMIDILAYVLNEDPVVECVSLSHSRMTANPTFLLRMSSGLSCTVTGLDMDMHSLDITAHFTRGRSSVWHGGFSEFSEVKIENALYPGFSRLIFDTDYQSANEQLIEENKGVMSILLDDLINAHEQGAQPCSNLSTALAAQSIVDGLVESEL